MGQPNPPGGGFHPPGGGMGQPTNAGGGFRPPGGGFTPPAPQPHQTPNAPPGMGAHPAPRNTAVPGGGRPAPTPVQGGGGLKRKK
jgi:hypothetical protein